MSGIPEGSSLADLLDSRRLFQFVVAAEAPTLAAAAADLFITQQALSSAIRQLERDLGVELFSRAQRSLQLTDAGHELYTGAKPLLAGIRVLANTTRNISNPQRAFVIAHSPAISGEEVYRIIEPIVVADPAASITVRQVFPSTMRDGLLDGSLDLALRRGVDMPADLATDTLLYQPLRIAVVQSHPLAAQDCVDITEIAEHPIVVWAPPRHSFYTDLLVSHCRRSGFEPRLLINPVQGTPPPHGGACAPGSLRVRHRRSGKRLPPQGPGDRDRQSTLGSRAGRVAAPFSLGHPHQTVRRRPGIRCCQHTTTDGRWNYPGTLPCRIHIGCSVIARTPAAYW